MYKLYVVFYNGTGYTKDFPDMAAVLAELNTEAIRDEEPAVVNITYLDEDVSERGPKVHFGQSRVGDSSISGTKVAD